MATHYLLLALHCPVGLIFVTSRGNKNSTIMKKQFLSFCAVAVAVSFAACSDNTGTSSTTTDSGSTTTTNTTVSSAPTTTTTTSSNSYAAMADTLKANSAKGYYLNPKTGKAYKGLTMDATTGAITDDAGQQVWRYVDNRDWEVYGDDNMDDTTTSWNQVGKAKMDNDKIMYQGEGDKWVDYDTKYKASDDAYLKKHKVSDNGMKEKMVTQDGDKIKMKTNEQGDTKIKVNGDKMKMDKDGNVKKN